MNYLTNTSELTAVADAIREKGGTSAPLTYPFGYVSAIQDIQTGGGDIDALINRTISGTYENSTVTTIGPYAFASCASLSRVSLPSVETVEFGAFMYTTMQEYSFPACKTIGSSAFYSCYPTRSISFPVCESIGAYAFGLVTLITEATFPECTYIGAYAFASCISLANVSFPKCTYISDGAFNRCPIQEVFFPLCEEMSYNVFQDCKELKSASFPVCKSIGIGVFSGCTSLVDVSFPVLETIGRQAFNSCSSLAELSLPACSYISDNAFSHCVRLVSLHLMGGFVASLAASTAFVSTPIGGYSASAGQYGSIYVPASLLTDYQTATNWTYYSSRFVGV